jgi:hypothetical protein
MVKEIIEIWNCSWTDDQSSSYAQRTLSEGKVLLLGSFEVIRLSCRHLRVRDAQA